MLEERIYKDYLTALKNREKHTADFLSFIRAELKNFAIDLRKEKLEDLEVIKVLKKQKKRLQETKENILKSERKELLKTIEEEIAILDRYLPRPLKDGEVEAIVEEVIKDIGATSLKDMGKVMKEVLAKVAERAEAKKVSEIVKRKLSSG